MSWLRDEITMPRWHWLLIFVGVMLILAAQVVDWLV